MKTFEEILKKTVPRIENHPNYEFIVKAGNEFAQQLPSKQRIDWKDIVDDFYVKYDLQISAGLFKGKQMLMFVEYLKENYMFPESIASELSADADEIEYTDDLTSVCVGDSLLGRNGEKYEITNIEKDECGNLTYWEDNIKFAQQYPKGHNMLTKPPFWKIIKKPDADVRNEAKDETILVDDGSFGGRTMKRSDYDAQFKKPDSVPEDEAKAIDLEGELRKYAEWFCKGEIDADGSVKEYLSQKKDQWT